MSPAKTIKSFVKQFAAIVVGDDATAQGEKTLRKASSAFNTHISIMEGESVSYEDKVTEAQENLEKARVNFGKTEFDRDQYIRVLVEAKSRLKQAEKNLESHIETLEFLKEEALKLQSEETEA